jgi:hypothetical protein
MPSAAAAAARAAAKPPDSQPARRSRVRLHLPALGPARGRRAPRSARFLYPRDNVILLGPPETGPTHRGARHLISVTVRCSTAYDALRTPFGERERTRPGGATHFPRAALRFHQVQIVGRVRGDLADDDSQIRSTRRSDPERSSRQVVGSEDRLPALCRPAAPQCGPYRGPNRGLSETAQPP